MSRSSSRALYTKERGALKPGKVISCALQKCVRYHFTQTPPTSVIESIEHWINGRREDIYNFHWNDGCRAIRIDIRRNGYSAERQICVSTDFSRLLSRMRLPT